MEAIVIWAIVATAAWGVSAINWASNSARADELEKTVSHERSQTGQGWEDECKFWRNVYNSTAETKRIEDQFKDNA